MTKTLKRPKPLTQAERKTLANILKKARAFKAYKAAQSPPLLKVKAGRARKTK